MGAAAQSFLVSDLAHERCASVVFAIIGLAVVRFAIVLLVLGSLLGFCSLRDLLLDRLIDSVRDVNELPPVVCATARLLTFRPWAWQ